MAGIVILLTKGPEYRVAFMSNTDHIYGEFNDNTTRFEPNSESIYDNFEGSEVYGTYEDALKYAVLLDGDLGIHLDDGIMLVDSWRHIVYNNL